MRSGVVHVCVEFPYHGKHQPFCSGGMRSTAPSLSTTEVQAEVSGGFTTPKTRIAKFCFAQISQKQHFPLCLQAVSDCGPALPREGIIRKGGNVCCYINASIGLTTVS